MPRPADRDDLDRAIDGMLGPSGPHPDDGDLAAYVAGTLPRDTRATIGRHLDACADCRRLVDDVRAVTTPSPVASRPARAGVPWPVVAGLAALLVIGVGIAVWWSDRGAAPAWQRALAAGGYPGAARVLADADPRLRFAVPPARGEPDVWRGEADGLRLDTPRGRVEDVATGFRFSLPTGAAPISVRVRWLDGETVIPCAESTAAATATSGGIAVAYPADATPLPRAEALGAARPLQWAVEYRVGGRRRTSPWQSFVLCSEAARARLAAVEAALDERAASGRPLPPDLAQWLRADAREALGLRASARAALESIANPTERVTARIAALR